jgi:hypothetical protein
MQLDAWIRTQNRTVSGVSHTVLVVHTVRLRTISLVIHAIRMNGRKCRESQKIKEYTYFYFSQESSRVICKALD